MFNFGKSSKAIYRELLHKTLTFLSINELGDSSIKEIVHRDFSKGENIRLDDTGPTHGAVATYHNNYGRMADGLYVRMPDADPTSYNVLTSVVLNPVPCQSPDYRVVADYINARNNWVQGDAIHNRTGNRIPTRGPLDKWIDPETGQWHPPASVGAGSIPPNIADNSGHIDTHQWYHTDNFKAPIPVNNDDGSISYLNENGRPLFSKFYGETIKSNKLFAYGMEGLYVFVDGRKVPDSRVNLYLSSSNTNLVLAKNPYFEYGKDEYELVVERRFFARNTYGGICVTDPTEIAEIKANKNVEMWVDHNEFVNPRTGHGAPLDIEHIMVYIDGVLKTGIVRRVEQNLKHVVVYFDPDFIWEAKESIEVAIDSSIEYIATKSTTSGIDQIPYVISDTFIDAIYGPRDRDNCMFFLNGLRVSNARVNQTGRLNFNHFLDQPLTARDKYTIVYTNSGIVDDRSITLYSDDYFYYNMQGTTRTSGSILGLKTDTIFDVTDSNGTFLSDKTKEFTAKALYSEKYLEESKKKLYGLLWTDRDVETDNEDKYYVRIQRLLKHNPQLMKDFLENFGNPPRIISNFNWNGESPVLIDVGSIYEIGWNVMRITTINGLVAKFELFTTTHNRMFYGVTIDDPEKYFNLGNKNEVVIWESKVKTDRYSVIETPIERMEVTVFDDRPDYTWEYRIITDTFGGIVTTDDLIVLAITREVWDPDGIYMSGDHFGYKVIHPTSTVILNGKIYITWNQQDPFYDKVVLSSRRHFGFQEITVHTDDVSYESLFNQLYIGTTNFFHDNNYYQVKIPLIHDGSFFVFNKTTGARMFRDTDFLYVTPEITTMRESGFFLKRFFKTGDKIIFAYFPDYTTDSLHPEMAALSTYPNKYALLYLGALPFPYSPDYVRINANDKMITKSDVDILSNKLIRLPEIETWCLDHRADDNVPCFNCDLTLGPEKGGSLYNVYVDYSFKVPLSDLEPFISLVNVDTEFELLIAKHFEGYDLRIYGDSTPLHDLAGGRNAHATLTYETFRENVDRNQKTPNPIRRMKQKPETVELHRYHLYLDAWLRYFVGFRNKSVLKCFEYIPEKVLNELSLFVDSRARKNDPYDAPITPNVFNLMSDIGVETHYGNPSRYLGFYHGQVMKIFLDTVLEHLDIPLVEVEQRFNEYPQSNILFKHDLLPISALVSFEGEDILLGGIDRS